jgi:periplasmic protein TonB
MASKKAKKPREAEKTGAVVIPFPVVARRGAEIAAALPFSLVPRREAPETRAAPNSANSNERPALPPAAHSKWWEIGFAISIALHLAAAAAFQAKYTYDLERAAGAAAAVSTEGAIIIPIEVVVTAALPSATPTDATAPDALKAAPTTPKTEMAADKKAKSAPPPKSDEALEVVPAAKETPQPDREKPEQKKERAQQSTSAAANPSPAAAARAEGRAGAGGRAEFGGTANVSSYQAEVLAHLQRYRIYPPDARNRGITGTAMVRFALASSGGVISASLGRSSGAAILDEAALSMVRRASPFPPIPPGLGRSQMDFAAPIRFDLR